MNNLESFQLPEVKRSPSRFRNPIGKYRLNRTRECISCGKCVEICPYEVHVARRGRVMVENAYRCVGKDCENTCIEA